MDIETDCDRRLIAQARLAMAAETHDMALRALGGAGVLFVIRNESFADVFIVGEDGNIDRFWYPDRMRMCGRHGYQWAGQRVRDVAVHDSDAIITNNIRGFFGEFLMDGTEAPVAPIQWRRRFLP